jgi:Spy/CpxP family protein refolding chaperone
MAEDDLRDKLIQILKESGTREETRYALRSLLTRALKDGEKRETILTKMEDLRKSVSDEQEDILLEVMDYLVGWCSPHAKL